MQAPAGDDQRAGESAKQGQQNPHRAAVESALPCQKLLCPINRPGLQLVHGGDGRGAENGDDSKHIQSLTVPCELREDSAAMLRLPFREEARS